jgi:hypothetical protein
MVGNEEAAGTSDSYYVAGAISANSEVMILIQIIRSSVGHLDHANFLAHFKVLFCLDEIVKFLRRDHHLPHDDC